jgi:hypothetical protein
MAHSKVIRKARILGREPPAPRTPPRVVTPVICPLRPCGNKNDDLMSRWRTILLLVWVAAGSCLVQAKQLAVIADSSNTTTNLTAATLVKIFNAQTRTWPDGKPITIVMRDPSSADMHLIMRKLFSMTPEQAQAFIQEHKESIIVADSDEAVLRFVSTHRGAIGIVDLYSLTSGVNVLKIDGKLPVEQGYLLR